MEESQPRSSARSLPEEIAGALLRGATVLTPTVHAARQLAEAADAVSRTGERSSWCAPDILPWSAWARSQWQAAVYRGVDSRILLNQAQEHAVWAALLQKADATITNIPSQVRLCMQAATLLGRYGPESPSAMHWRAASRESALFQRWYMQFQQVCDREGYISPAHLEAALAGLIRERRLAALHEYVVFDLGEVTPSQQRLLSALGESGSTVLRMTSEEGPGKVSCVQYSSPDAELRACAQWVRYELESDPAQALSLVVPDLHEVRSELERELRRVVCPVSADMLQDVPQPFQISAGRPLHGLALIADALSLLRWCTGDISLDNVGALLRSSHLSLATSPEAGARAEALLRRRAPLRKQLSLAQATLTLHTLAARQLLAVRDEAVRLPTGRQSYAFFADRARNLLNTAGWPGGEPLHDEELQAVDGWQRILDDVASLDLLDRQTTWPVFLEELERQSAEAVFTPEHRGATVQVTTVAGALGSRADALWLLHASTDTWPQRAQPSPLLPLALQRDLGMPGVDTLRDEQAAADHLRRLLHGTVGSVRLSCSRGETDEAGGPAPLAQRVVEALGGTFSVDEAPGDDDEAGAQLETFFDTTPLPSLPTGEVYGGVSVLTAQAQCGFRAWAEKRLFATDADVVEDGFSPRERGDQVHAVLQKFWERTRSQWALHQSLLDVGADGVSARDRTLRECIDEVSPASAQPGWDGAYIELQKQRLFRLVSAWLNYEAQRPPFEVLHLEKDANDVPVGPLQLRMRVDRVDCVFANGDEDAAPLGVVLIDYKTGSGTHTEKDWLGERPDQPQLPAYALTAAGVQQVDGIAFASVKAGEKGPSLKGLSEPGLLPARRQQRDAIDFHEQKLAWRSTVESLAEAFAEGDAAVAPKTYPKTCETCAQRVLCRLDVTALLNSATDETEEEGAEAAW